jgi:hypothetical protein
VIGRELKPFGSFTGGEPVGNEPRCLFVIELKISQIASRSFVAVHWFPHHEALRRCDLRRLRGNLGKYLGRRAVFLIAE